jgi:hypothetical protein
VAVGASRGAQVAIAGELVADSISRIWRFWIREIAIELYNGLKGNKNEW